MDEFHHRPSTDRLSIITAMVLLAYALTAFVKLPGRIFSFQFPGFLFEFQVNFITLVSILVAILAAAGTEWLISSHPLSTKRLKFHQWILPALTALVIGVPLNILNVSPEWWIIFTLGGMLFATVISAEYISVDPADSRYPLATIALTAVSLALLLVLTIAVRGAGLRLYLQLAAIVPSAALVNARIISLRLEGRWPILWSLAVALIIAQLIVGLHYLPLSPLQFGILTTAIVYAMTSMIGSMEEDQPLKSIWIEPAIVTVCLALAAVLLG